MTRHAIAVVVVLAAFVPRGAAQQPSALAFHDLSSMTPYPFAGMKARGAMGQTASMFLAEVPPGAKTTPHHHHQEQFMFGLEGAMKFVLAGSSPQALSRLTGSFAPANVQHGNVNDAGPARYIEFQPVLRPDWYPPHPRRPREGTPEPLPLPAGRTVTEDFSAESRGWMAQNGARSKSLNGDTATVTVWHLPAGTGPIDIAAGPAAERFVFVADGDLAVTEGTTVRNVSHEMLIVVPPAARTIRLSASKRGAAVAVVFAALKR